MYSKFYGLSHKPFELIPNPHVIYLSETHEEALAVLLYGVYNRKGFLQISGDVGTGKSTLVQALFQKLGKNVHLCHIPNPNFTVEEFYYYICVKFELDEFDGNRAKFVLNLAEFLKQCRKKDEFALLIIDEAQVLSLELLEEIRLLSNQEYTESGVLSIFFVGQPELNALLKHKKLEPLRNRIGIHFNLEPLTLDETVAYIQFRLKKAGRTVLLFSNRAFEKIHEASGGIPRSINILCDNALLAGFAEQRGVIDENIIIDCVKELQQPDVDSAPSEDDETDIKMKTEPTSAKPLLKEHYNDKKDKRTNTLRRKLAFVFVIICALFFAMMYTTEYWGRLPGTKSAKDWFENFHVNEVFFEKIKGLFIAQKNEAELNLSKKNIIPEKATASSERLEEKNNVLKKPAVETKPIAESSKRSFPKDDANTEPIKTRQNTDETNYVNINNKKESESTETNLTGFDATAEQIKISRNPDGTNYISITRQVGSGPAKKNIPKDDAITDSIKTQKKSGEINYVSITSQVGGANIRLGPSMNFNILRTVSPGYPFRVIDRQAEWFLVEDFKKRKGWIARRLIVENNTVILMFDKGNLRKGPSYHDDIVASIDYGNIMQIEEKRDHWLKVNKNGGIVGWIHEDMVWP